jgi:hypothetical protein
MAAFDEVRRIALALPETDEVSGGQRGSLQWRVKGKLFVWDRPLGKNDQKQYVETGQGDAPPDGDILGARVEDEAVKFALIEQDPTVFFTIPHFNGYNAVLIRLDEIDLATLEEVVTDAWLDRAPAKLAKTWLDAHPDLH